MNGRFTFESDFQIAFESDQFQFESDRFELESDHFQLFVSLLKVIAFENDF